MKKRNKIAALTLASIFGLTQTACLGSFNLTQNLHEWNTNATGNKFVNNLLFWVMNIIPVYGAAVFIDAVIFNLIEFWTGSNPIAMNEGEVEKQLYERDGITYEMKATKNNFEITVLNGEKAGEKVHLQYNPSDKSWNKLEENGIALKLVEFNDDMTEVTLFQPNGATITVENNMDNFMALKNQKTWQSTYFYASAE